MFTYTGLTTTQVQMLKTEHHIYMLDSGRMSMSGCNVFFKTRQLTVVNTKNLRYVAEAINEVVRKTHTYALAVEGDKVRYYV
jgi:aspartate aminotransferase, cytoplasmic